MEPFKIQFVTTQSTLRLYHQLCLGFLTNLLVHEFNNSLTSLSGYAQMALAIRREDILLKAANVFHESSTKLHELVQHISSFGRESMEDFVPADPYQSALRIQKILHHHLSKRNIDFEVTNRATHPVLGNQVLLALAALTFILDARDRVLSTATSGAIGILIEESGEQTRLVFSDSSRLPSPLAAVADSPGIMLPPDADPRQELAPHAFHGIALLHKGAVLRPEAEDAAVVMVIPTFTKSA